MIVNNKKSFSEKNCNKTKKGSKKTRSKGERP